MSESVADENSHLRQLDRAWNAINWWDLLVCGDCLTELEFQRPAGRGVAEYACPECGGSGSYPSKSSRSERWQAVRGEAIERYLHTENDQ